MDADSPSPDRARAGGIVLSLLAVPLCAPILRAHLDGPLRLPELRERISGAATTTLRGQVGNLRAIGALERQVLPGVPYTVENRLSECGHEILEVAEQVEAWLSRAPQGPIELGSEAAKGAIRALVGGWDSTVIQALAAEPLSLTELSASIGGLNYPALERRLSAMRVARQIAVQPNASGQAKPYAVTEWTRRAVGPLLAAGRCECRHLAERAGPAVEDDIEAAFLLAIPLATLSATKSGSCLLAVIEQSDGATADYDQADGLRRVAGVRVEVSRGRVTSCVRDVEPGPGASADGSVEAWTKAVVEGSLEELRVGGGELAHPLIESIRSALQPA